MSSKKIAKPAAYKNTYFWIAGILVLIGIIGMTFLAGENAIRDPGQKREGGLALLYFAGAVIMIGADALTEAGGHLLAEVAILGAASCYALSAVYARRFARI